MESQAFEGLMNQLPEEVKVILVLFVFLVLFYPKLATFFSHFSPQERAIRRARRQREMQELGIAVEEMESPPPAAATPVEEPKVAAAPPPGSSGERARGFAGRLARLQSTQFAWCFAGAFSTHAVVSAIAQLELARRLSESFGTSLPYILIAPNVLIFGSVYALGITVLGVMFFSNRGRWGSFLLGLGLALLLWMLQVGLQRAMVSW
jgi:hypothetical protein